MNEPLEDLLLVIDVGNTNAVLGLYRGDQLEVTWRIASLPRTTDELGVLLLGLFAARQIPISAVTHAICASVVPPTIHATRRACQRYLTRCYTDATNCSVKVSSVNRVR